MAAAAAVAMDSVRDSASGSAQDSGSRTVSRTVFTEEEVNILRKAYEEGLKVLEQYTQLSYRSSVLE